MRANEWTNKLRNELARGEANDQVEDRNEFNFLCTIFTMLTGEQLKHFLGRRSVGYMAAADHSPAAVGFVDIGGRLEVF